MRESDNEYDSNAVAVYSTEMEKLGHLSRTDARRYQNALQRVEAAEKVVRCEALPYGGDAKRENIGAWLDLQGPRSIRVK